MEENTNTQQSQQMAQQAPESNPTPEQDQVPQQTEQQKKGLLPGQEHEDELDYMGAAMFGLIAKGFGWLKNRLSPPKV